MQVESRIGKISRDAEDIYPLLSDFTKAATMMPQDKLKDAVIEADRVKVNHPEAGDIEFKIMEKTPCTQIKYSGVIKNSFDFFMWLQLKTVADHDTRLKITIRAEVPSVIGWTIKGKIKEMLDQIMDRIEKI